MQGFPKSFIAFVLEIDIQAVEIGDFGEKELWDSVHGLTRYPSDHCKNRAFPSKPIVL